MLHLTQLSGFMAGGLPTFPIIIAASGRDVVIRDLVNAFGYDGSSPVVVDVVVNAGVVIGSTSTATHALDSGSFPLGSFIRLTIQAGASVVGKGGDGSGAFSQNPAPAALPGGPALRAQVVMEITNLGTIGGGGGGGGGGTDGVGNSDAPYGGAGAGDMLGRSGRQAYNNDSAPDTYDPATNATLTTGGAGHNDAGNSGGAGGNLGQAGASAGGSNGGAAGAAVNGNSFITWISNGTRLGAINA